MKYTVSGMMSLKGEKRKFSKDVEAPNEALAKEKAYALFGSNHKLKRGKIKIEGITKAKA